MPRKTLPSNATQETSWMKHLGIHSRKPSAPPLFHLETPPPGRIAEAHLPMKLGSPLSRSYYQNQHAGPPRPLIHSRGAPLSDTFCHLWHTVTLVVPCQPDELLLYSVAPHSNSQGIVPDVILHLHMRRYAKFVVYHTPSVDLLRAAINTTWHPQ